MMGLEYPKPPEGQHLVRAITELGWSGNSGMGIIPLSWLEIKSYADATEALSEPWEFRCIREMSSAYTTERNSNDLLRIAPNERVKND